MAGGQGLGTLPQRTPFPRFWYWNLVFSFVPQGPLTVFAFAFLAPLGILPLVFFLFASRCALCVRCVSLSLLTLTH